jgi:predicted aldo/keto reductase-like oxidoreductase
MCGVCSKECPRGIAVPDILRYALYYTDHGKTALATDKYRALPADLKYDACNHCGRCSDVCPNKLPVTRMLQTAHQLLG